MKKSWSSREVIKKLKANGWYYVDTSGDHYHYKHPTKKGKITVVHPQKDMKIYELQSLEKVSGLKF